MTKVLGKELTWLVVLNIVLVTAYSAMKADPTSVIGFAMWASFMLPVILRSTERKMRRSTPWLIVLAGYFVLHAVLAQTSLLTVMTYLLVMLYYFVLDGAQIQHRPIRWTFVALLILSVLVDTQGIYVGLVSSYYLDSFEGIFSNPNTCGLFLCVAFFVVLTFRKSSEKPNIWLMLAVIVLIIATKSRNALLFLILFGGFYKLQTWGWRRFVPYVFLAIWALALFYLVVIEPQAAVGVEVLGKKAGSAGRSIQVLTTIQNFPLTLFGVGADLPNNLALNLTGYPVHNAYINTIYAMGVVYMAIYIAFIVRIYRATEDFRGTAFLLAVHIYFFFEPGMMFSPLMLNSLPIIALLCSKRS